MTTYYNKIIESNPIMKYLDNNRDLQGALLDDTAIARIGTRIQDCKASDFFEACECICKFSGYQRENLFRAAEIKIEDHKNAEYSIYNYALGIIHGKYVKDVHTIFTGSNMFLLKKICGDAKLNAPETKEKIARAIKFLQTPYMQQISERVLESIDEECRRIIRLNGFQYRFLCMDFSHTKSEAIHEAKEEIHNIIRDALFIQKETTSVNNSSVVDSKEVIKPGPTSSSVTAPAVGVRKEEPTFSEASQVIHRRLTDKFRVLSESYALDKERSYVGAFFRTLLGALGSIATLFLATGSRAYRDYFFKPRSIRNMRAIQHDIRQIDQRMTI